MSDLAQTIRDKALALGYENCGITPVASVLDYEKNWMNALTGFRWAEHNTNTFEALPGHRINTLGRSLIVLVQRYSVYDIPDKIDDLYAKSYLFDARINSD